MVLKRLFFERASLIYSTSFICELHPFAWESFGVTYNEFTSILETYERKITLLDDRKKTADLPYYGTVLF